MAANPAGETGETGHVWGPRTAPVRDRAAYNRRNVRRMMSARFPHLTQAQEVALRRVFRDAQAARPRSRTAR